MIRLIVAQSVLVLLIAGGCTGSDLVPAGGKLTQGGLPVAGATVMLHYPGPGGDYCVGTTDNQGVFTLTSNGRAGARPGKQIGVTVVKYESIVSGEIELPKHSGGPPADFTPSPSSRTSKDLRATKPGKNLVPAEYGDPQNPKLKIDIPEGGSSKLDIALP